MRFRLEQRFNAPVDAVARAFTDPRLYERLGELPRLGNPRVLGREEAGDRVHLQVHYRFTGDLSGAVRRVLDPAKLSWVEHSVHDLSRYQVEIDVVPDHYRDRFRSSGLYAFHAEGAGTLRLCEGEVVVSAPFIARAVEGAIVSGVREHLDAEAEVVERFLAG